MTPKTQVAVAHPAVVTPPPGSALIISNNAAVERSIKGFWRTANGNVPASWTIMGGFTGSGATQLATDGARDLWLARNGAGRDGEILEFSPTAVGNARPIFAIWEPICAGANGGQSRGIAVDSTNNVYVTVSSYPSGTCILVFPPGSTTASREIDDPHLMQPWNLMIRGKTIFVSDYSENAIYGYPLSSSGTVSPTFTIAGSITGLSRPMGFGFDGRGNLYVAQDSRVDVWNVGLSGNVAPSRTIVLQGSGTTAIAVGSLTLSAADVLGTSSEIVTYRVGDAGPTPLRTLIGPKTRIYTPYAILYR